MKKVFALVLVLMMCSTFVSFAEEYTTVIQKGDYTLPIVSEPTELTLLTSDTHVAGASFKNGNSLVMNEFMKQSGITLNFDCVPGSEYREVMELRLSSQSDLPDIMLLEGKQDGIHILRYYEEGLLQPLKQLIEDYAPNIKRIYTEYPGINNPLILPDGEQAAIGGVSIESGFASIAIRQDWLTKLNLDMPTTPEELIEVGLAFIKDDPNGNGAKDEIGIGAKELFDLKQLGSIFGLNLCTGSGWERTADNQIVYQWVTDPYRDFLRFLNEAYTRGALPKDFASYTYEQFDARIADGTAGICSRMFNSEYANFLMAGGPNQTNQPGSLWVPIQFGQYKDYTANYTMEPKAMVWSTCVVTTAAKDKPLAVRFLDYAFAGEGSVINNLGIEGINYKKDENGLITPIDSWVETYSDPTAFVGERKLPCFTAKDYLLEGRMAALESQNPEAVKTLKDCLDFVIGFNRPVYQSPIPSQEAGLRLSAILADMNTFRDEMLVKFINGELSIDNDWETYVANMNSMGAAEMRTIYQDIADAMLK